MSIPHDTDLPVDILLVDPATDSVDMITPDVDTTWVSDYTAGDYDDLPD